jgi:hypothetical protein
VSATTNATLRHHNRVLRAAEKRAQELEPRLVRLLTPTLRQAGFSAARQFRARATDHLHASADWSPPAPDELLDVDELIAKLRTKTDPVRRAVIETMIDATVAGTGITFDVTHPLVGAVLTQSGRHVRNIAETTQLNVMKIIRASLDNGLSIPDTAAAIRAGMREAAPARAVTIARSEIGSAVNGGSLAATQIVASATGESFWKTWLATEDERTRADHADADGQVVGLADYFQVGDSAMLHPGDPSAPADECVNCRCAISFTDQPPT